MLNERKLTKSELAKREDIVMKMKKNKRALVKQYGKDAESVMYGRATNQAKKQSEGMNQDKLREMLKDALQNPKAADLNKDGKLSDYEEKRGAAIEKNLDESSSSEERRIAKRAIRSIAKYRGVGEDEARNDLIRAAKELGNLNETQITENKQEAFDELQMIMEQLYELSDQAKMIFRNNFPGEYRRLDAYGALDFGTSSNRYDVTLEGALENLDMEDDDEDLMEGKDSTHKVKYSKSNDTYQVWLGDEIVTDFATEEKADAEAKRLNALQDAKRVDKAQVGEDLDLGHEDNEPHMLKGDLYRIGKYAMELYQMVDGFEGKGEVDFPHWWQSKIIKSKDALVGAKHYLDFETKEPEIDAMVGVAQDTEAIDENALGMTDSRLTSKQHSDLDYAVRDDSAYTFGNDPYADDQLRYKYAVKMGFLEEKKDIKEGTWSVGSTSDIKKVMGILDNAMGVEDREEMISILINAGKLFYDAVGDDLFHDDIDGAKDEASQGNMDRAQNRLSDAYERARFFFERQMDREGIKEEAPGKADKVASDIQKTMNAAKGDEAKTHQLKKARTAMNKGDLDKAQKIADRIAKMLKNK